MRIRRFIKRRRRRLAKNYADVGNAVRSLVVAGHVVAVDIEPIPLAPINGQLVFAPGRMSYTIVS